MHELGRFIQSLMDKESMGQPDLVRRSGLNRQHVNAMLKAEKLSRLPEPKTIDGLHRAFPHVSREVFVLQAARAMGIPVDVDVSVPDYSKLTNEALIGILKERLDGGSSDGRQPEAEKSDDGGSGADPDPVFEDAPASGVNRDEAELIEFPAQPPEPSGLAARRLHGGGAGKRLQAETEQLGEDSQDNGEGE